MYEGVDVVESSAVKLQMVGSGSPAGWWSINDTMLPPPPHQLPPSTLFAPSWNHTQAQLPDSWTQLLLGGLAGEDDKHSLMSCMHPKYLHNWDQKSLHFSSQSNHSHQTPLSDQCNSTVTTNGAAPKKAKIQPSSVKSTLKVRKEKVGDRITALHQLVSPFGKTDTASVLLEAIGYIKFLQNQIEALSLPYLDSGSDIMRQQHPQLNGKCIKRKGMSDDNLECDEKPKKDLKSRGLCLVPISCTLDVGNDNGTDYWAPAFGANFR